MFDQLFRFPELPLHNAGLQRKTHVKHGWSAEVRRKSISVIDDMKRVFTLEACRRTSTTTLTGSPGVISFMASMHHLYACKRGEIGSRLKHLTGCNCT